MYNQKIRWYYVIFFGILLLSIGLEEWTYFLTLIPLSVAFIFCFSTKTSEKVELEIIRELEQYRFQENEHIEIALTIRNTSKYSIDALEILDELPLQVSLKQGSNHVLSSLNAGEKTTIRYKICCDYRGRWTLGPTHAKIKNFLDSSFIVKSFHETKETIIVVPYFDSIKDMPFRTKYPRISDGPFHSKFKGEGLDFAGVREFVNSDSLTRINWPATAKYGKLFTNEYELFRTADLLLILDVTEKTTSILEDQIKVVLSVSEHFLKYKCKVGLIIVRDTVDRFDLSSSRQQLIKFTEKLIDIQATKVENYNILRKRIINNVETYFPLNCMTIFISPLIHAPTNQIFIEVAQRRRNCFFLMPSIISNEWKYIKEKDNASNLLTHHNLLLKREIELAKIAKRGLLVFEWDTATPFAIFMNKLKQVTVKRGRR